MDWITLTSERIALVEVDSVTDSVFPPPAMVLDRTIHYRLVREILGDGPPADEFTQRTWNTVPQPSDGDSLLILWQVNPTSEDWIRWFDLTRPGSFIYEPALTTAFGIVHEPDSILALVERRVRMIEAGRPLGDDRSPDFRKGLGSLVYWMPAESEAQKATWQGSINELVVPADFDRLPSILEETRSEWPYVRASAARNLIQYPLPSAIDRLTEMLADTSTCVIETNRKRLRFHAPRAQAYQSLRFLGVEAVRPHGFETDSLYID